MFGEPQRIFALMDDRDRGDFGARQRQRGPDRFPRRQRARQFPFSGGILVEQLKTDEAIAEADTLLLTVPN